MATTLICYSRCSTCAKAARWLAEHGIEAAWREITTENPTREELSAWLAASGLPVSRFFNTSGMKYREMNLKERVANDPVEALLTLLATDGMLVKRPILLYPGGILVGFRETEWTNALL